MSTLPDTMIAAVYTAAGDPSVIRMEERSVPRPGDGQVVIKVYSSALNRADIIQREGRYPAPPGAPPDIPGLEFAGRIAATGRGVARWHEGDEVFGLVPGGAHAEYVISDQKTITAKPATLQWMPAGASPEMFITAYDALATQAGLKDQETVLVHAATSGVGIAAVQVARELGARVFGTGRSREKLERVRHLGFLDTLVPDPALPQGAFAAWIGAHTGSRGVDVVMDLVGGRYTTASLRVLARGGRLMLIGTLDGPSAEIDLSRVLGRRLQIRGTVLRSRSLEERRDYTARFSETVVPWLAEGRVAPVIDSAFPLSGLAEAHRLLESNTTVGKIAITVCDD